MAYGGFIMDAAAELGRNPVSKHQIQPEYGDEQAGICLARPNARTGTEEQTFSCSADHEQDWQPQPADPYAAISEEDHTCIHRALLSVQKGEYKQYCSM